MERFTSGELTGEQAARLNALSSNQSSLARQMVGGGLSLYTIGGVPATIGDNTTAELNRPRFVRLTGVSSGQYSWQERRYNPSEEDGPTSGTHNAYPVPPWGAVSIPTGTSSTGTPCILWRNDHLSDWWFLPVDRWYADATDGASLVCNPGAALPITVTCSGGGEISFGESSTTFSHSTSITCSGSGIYNLGHTTVDNRLTVQASGGQSYFDLRRPTPSTTTSQYVMRLFYNTGSPYLLWSDSRYLYIGTSADGGSTIDGTADHVYLTQDSVRLYDASLSEFTDLQQDGLRVAPTVFGSGTDCEAQYLNGGLVMFGTTGGVDGSVHISCTAWTSSFGSTGLGMTVAQDTEDRFGRYNAGSLHLSATGNGDSESRHIHIDSTGGSDGVAGEEYVISVSKTNTDNFIFTVHRDGAIYTAEDLTVDGEVTATISGGTW